MLHRLPKIAIQPTLLSVIEEVTAGLIPEDKIWLSFYQAHGPSIHDHINVVLDDIDRSKIRFKNNNKEGLLLDQAADNAYTYKVSCPSLGISQKSLIFPREEYSFSSCAPSKASAFAISPDLCQFATGHLNGSIHIFPVCSDPEPIASWPQHRTTSIRQCQQSRQAVSRCHKSSISSLRYFPSSKVLLSSSADFTLCILSADPETNFRPDSFNRPTQLEAVRTFIGHTRNITSCGIIGKGKTIVSGSMDGTLRTWDVSAAKCLQTIKMPEAAGVTSLVVLPSDPDGDESYSGFATLSDGYWTTFDLRDPQTPSLEGGSIRTSPLSSVAYDASRLHLATGSINGVVSLYDIRHPTSPLDEFSRSSAKIESLAFLSQSNSPGESLAVASEDGLPFVASLSTSAPLPSEGVDPSCVVLAELAGMDCDAVRHITTNGAEVWTAADDGMARRYIL